MNYRFIEEALIDFRTEKIGLKEAMFIITESFEKARKQTIEEVMETIAEFETKSSHSKLK